MRLRRFAGTTMGSPLRMTVIGGPAKQALEARDAAWSELAAVDAELSRFQASSDLSRANVSAGTGSWHDAGPRLRRMLATAWRAQRATAGRFDARIIGILEAIGEHAGVPLPPSDLGGDHWLAREGRTTRVRLASPVDSGGLAKGLGLRWAIAAARAAAPRPSGMLLEAGGDIVASGLGPIEGRWSVGIEDPVLRGQLIATITLGEGAIATSSIAIRRWGPAGRQVHHLIDPVGRAPAHSNLLAVTVAWHDPAWAEIWSKALFIAGRSLIGPEARSRDLAVWWVESDGSIHMTPAARQLTTWVRDEVFAA